MFTELNFNSKDGHSIYINLFKMWNDMELVSIAFNIAFGRNGEKLSESEIFEQLM